MVAKGEDQVDGQDLALACGADAVFLGQSLNTLNMRSISEESLISCHSSHYESRCSPGSLHRGGSGQIQS